MIEALSGLFALYGLAGLTLALAFGQAGVPLPTSILLMSAGALIGDGDIDPLAAVSWALCGAVAGDQFGYFVGRLGRGYLDAQGSRRAWLATGLAKGQQFNARWGAWSVFFSRWLVSPLGPWVNLTSGIARFPWPLFTFWGVLGESIWVSAYLAIGYAFGTSIAGIADIIANAGWAIAGLAVTGFTGWLLWRRVRASRAATGPAAVSRPRSGI